MPGDEEYDRKEGAQTAKEMRFWLWGCAFVVGVIVLTYVVYAILLVRSGWRG